MRLWRLASERRARDFDGGYGISYDGRWNTRGRPVTYCSTVASLTALEKRVHVSDPGLLPTQVLVTYELPDNISRRTIEIADLPADWTVRATHTQSVGDRWLDSRAELLLFVPSVIMPIANVPDRNVLINHRRAEAASINVVQVIPFTLDRACSNRDSGPAWGKRAQCSMSSAYTIFSVCTHSGCAAH